MYHINSYFCLLPNRTTPWRYISNAMSRIILTIFGILNKSKVMNRYVRAWKNNTLLREILVCCVVVSKHRLYYTPCFSSCLCPQRLSRRSFSLLCWQERRGIWISSPIWKKRVNILSYIKKKGHFQTYLVLPLFHCMGLQKYPWVMFLSGLPCFLSFMTFLCSC